jgi:hypothetical protein
MTEKRTTKQIEADRLDLECFRLIDKIERFSKDHGDKQLAAGVAHLNGLRVNIRRHMHAKDREKTNG